MRSALPWLIVVLPAVAQARPEAPILFCDAYASSPLCASGLAPCETCHTVAPARNIFGEDLAATWSSPISPSDFASALPDALSAIADFDSDSDGATNDQEIAAGTFPGDPTSRPQPPAPEPDPVTAFRKTSLDVCGYSALTSEWQAVAEAADPWSEVDAQLAACFVQNYWRGRDGVLWQVAHRKIRPLAAIKSGDGAGDIPLADYEDDYNLYAYTHSGSRDAREVLTAQYIVDRQDGAITVYTAENRGALEDALARGFDVAQAVDTNQRAGLLTTRWNLASNTMFTAVPRTTAAQAYRAHLGYDIAKLQGLFPVEDEPVDYDAKDVTAEDCAICHSTLDPLTYPFAHYNGIGGGSPGALPYRNEPGRPARFQATDGPLVAQVPASGVLFGQPVRDLVEWARVAANSDAFARATVLDYWRLFIGADPSGEAIDEFEALVGIFQEDYQLESLIRALVRTKAYAAP